ncbi:MAG: hypothetical protein ACYTKC_14930, partial [Planctomycetota bacterium]
MVLMVLSTIRRFFTHSMTATGAGAAIEREVPVPELPDLSWVDEWVSNVRDHIYVREEDSVFIQRPNRAFHLNPQGVAMMKLLLSGQSIQQVLAPYRGSVQVWRDTEQFLLDVRKL